MNLVLIMLAYLMLAVYEAVPLIREGKNRELIAAGSVWFLGLITSMLIALNVQAPTPVDLMNLVSRLILEFLRLIF